tara:strand:+ start:7831 stop:8331 length:501 start_codon:yes stop_codon:yes gene_type:complete
MDITGTWAGQYTYGEDYEQLADTSVRFTLSLQQHGWQRLLGRPRLIGQCRDNHDDGGQKGLGKIHGRRVGRTLQFLKSMPESVRSDEWVQYLRDSFRAEFGQDLPAKLPDHCIAYQGEISEFGDSLSGSWQILNTIFHTDHGDVRYVNAGEGTWTARRTSPLTTEL